MMLTIVLLHACGKIETEDDGVTVTITDGQKILKGSFQNGAHPTSGEVFVFEESGSKKLGFTNFKTDNGPDLRVYLAKDLNAKEFIQVAGEVKNGNYSIALPSSADPTTQKYVLIWCKAFSVLFGSAELKK